MGPDGREVLLQHRAHWTSNGNTWGLAGGARDSHESAVRAALREAHEEAGLEPEQLRIRGEWVDDHGGWSYVTVVVDVVEPVHLVPNAESVELRWVPVGEVEKLPLHPGFAQSWAELREPAFLDG